MIANDINVSIEVVKLETTEVASFRPVCRSRSDIIMYVLSSTCIRSLFSLPLLTCLKPSFENKGAKPKEWFRPGLHQYCQMLLDQGYDFAMHVLNPDTKMLWQFLCKIKFE